MIAQVDLNLHMTGVWFWRYFDDLTPFISYTFLSVVYCVVYFVSVFIVFIF